MQARKDAKAAKRLAIDHTIKVLCLSWNEHWKGPNSAGHSDYVLRRLEADVFPALGRRAVAEITAPKLVSLAKKVKVRGALDIAKGMRQTCATRARHTLASRWSRWPLLSC